MAGVRTYRGTPRNLRLLATRLRAGELVAVPTETVYGLAADATDPASVERIFSAKGRPSNDPLIVHIASIRELKAVARVNDAALALARRFWPGPLTLVLPKTALIPDCATAGLPSVAVRMPDHPLFRKLIRLAGRPLAAPSANPFGYVSPTTAAHVLDGLRGRVSHVLDGGPCRIGLESTIVDLRDPRHPVLLRPGAVSRKAIAAALGRPVARSKRRGDGGAHAAPGGFTRHYSPRARVVLHRRLAPSRARANSAEAWLFLAKPAGSLAKAPNIFWLDARGSLKRAATRLFAVLRSLDRANFGTIHVEVPKGEGLGEALADRLSRAAAR